LCGRQIQEARIAHMVGVDAEQGVGRNVAQIIHGKDRSTPNLPLDADIHLH